MSLATICTPAKAGAQAAAKQRFPLPWAPAVAGEQPVVPCSNARAAREQRLDRRDPRPRETVNRVVMPREGACRDHLSFKVLRPASASTKLMIQNRMTTVGSDQPRCSKWW